MPDIIVIFEGKTVGRLSTEKPVIIIGRDPQSDIHIDYPAVSSEHARLSFLPEAVVIEDLKSTNGTYVNGQKVEKASVTENDTISISKFNIKFTLDKDMPEAGADPSETIVIKGKKSTWRKVYV